MALMEPGSSFFYGYFFISIQILCHYLRFRAGPLWNICSPRWIWSQMLTGFILMGYNPSLPWQDIISVFHYKNVWQYARFMAENPKISKGKDQSEVNPYTDIFSIFWYKFPGELGGFSHTSWHIPLYSLPGMNGRSSAIKTFTWDCDLKVLRGSTEA